MSDQLFERRLAAIVAADVVGYSRLMGLDETGTLTRLKALRQAVIEPMISRYYGRIVKLMGDGVLIEFPSVVDALACSVQIQRAILPRNAALLEEQRIELRIGINLGDIIVEGDDIYGDGVNIAARLEPLAEPGGICLSQAARDALGSKLPLDYEDMGAQPLKNIAESIRAFRVAVRPDAVIPEGSSAGHETAADRKKPWLLTWRSVAAVVTILLLAAGSSLFWRQTEIEPNDPRIIAHPLPDKPSIAVLPFKNLSADPDQEYFADGMTDDLITDLAKIESLFIIARNTMFTYKGRSVDVPDVARELGIQYVLDGSVRRSADQVRINAQLVDGISGEHVWTERYDRSLADIFALQDEVSSQIIAQLKIKLTPDENEKRARTGTDNQQAHDAYLKGWQLYRQYTPENFAAAIPHLILATELDPTYGEAWAALASIYWTAYRKEFSWAPIIYPNKELHVSQNLALVNAQQYLQKAMQFPTPLALQISSQLSADYRQHDIALSEAEQAVTLDPNDPAGHEALAWILIFAGQAEQAIASAETGMRLDPNYPAPFLYALGTAYLMLKQYDKAETALRRALELTPGNKTILAPLAVVLSYLEANEEAQATLTKFVEHRIYYSPKIESYLVWWPFMREADIRHFGNGLVKAGLCCEEALETYISGVRLGGTLK